MKKVLYITLAVMMFGGVAFLFSQSNLLEGTFGGKPITTTPTGGVSGGVTGEVTVNADTTMAKTYANSIMAQVSIAETALNDAIEAFNANEKTGLATAQSSALTAYNTASGAYTNLESVYSKIQTKYDEASANYDEVYATKEDYESQMTDAWEYHIAMLNDAIANWPDYYEITMVPDDLKTVWEELQRAYETCIAAGEASPGSGQTSRCSTYTTEGTNDSYNVAYPTIDEAEEVYNADSFYYCGSDYDCNTTTLCKEGDGSCYKGYTQLLAERDSYIDNELTQAYDQKENAYQKYTATKSYYDDGTTNLTQIKEYSDTASSYEFVDCKSITLTPDVYQMASGETEANFDFTITVKTVPNLIQDQTKIKEGITDFVKTNLLALFDTKTDKADYDATTQTKLGLSVGTPIGTTLSNGTTETTSTKKWYGTLSVESDSTTKVSVDGGTSAYTQLEIDMDSNESKKISVLEGLSGTNITVEDTENASCSSSLTIKPAISINNTPSTIPTISDTVYDTDGDGLTDDEETTLGTDTSDTDTDDDGLSDYDEVYTYYTDPLDSDTDDDNVNDGTEVTNGTDPLTSDLNVTPVTNDEVTDNTTNTTTSEEEEEETDELVDSLTPAEEETLENTDESYVCQDTFTDTYGHWGEDQICRMYEASVVNGKTDEMFDPDGDMTRAEAIKITVIMAGYDEGDAEGLTTEFKDINSNDWFYKYLLIAENNDIIRTRDFGEYFYPNEPVTRGDFVLYAVRAARKTSYDFETEFTDVSSSDYFAYSIAIASEAKVDVPYDDTDEEIGVIEGYSDGSFRPYHTITRAEAITVAYRMYLAWFTE